MAVHPKGLSTMQYVPLSLTKIDMTDVSDKQCIKVAIHHDIGSLLFFSEIFVNPTHFHASSCDNYGINISSSAPRSINARNIYIYNIFQETI